MWPASTPASTTRTSTTSARRHHPPGPCLQPCTHPLPLAVGCRVIPTGSLVSVAQLVMEDRIEGLNDGIIACFDLQVELRGEEVALVLSDKKPSPEVAPTDEEEDEDEQESISQSNSSSDSCSTSSEANGITFMELQYAYQSVAAQLRFRFGVTAGDRVLLCCKGQAAAEIVAMLACIKIGATFVPIDSSWVSAGTRLKDIIEDAQPTAAVVVAEDDNDSTVRALAEAGLYRAVYINDSGDIVQSFSTLLDDNGYSAETYSYTADDEGTDLAGIRDHPLYILYTSGSTGRPKGVLGTHKGLLNRIAWQWRRFPFLPGEVACRRTPLVFVDAMAEIFGALLSMTPLWCPPKQRLAAEGIGGIAAEANEAGVSRITLLPSQLHQALQLYADLGEVWQSLRTVFVSGEECTAGLVRLAKERLFEVTLVNLYGSTEVAGDVSFAVLSGGAESSAQDASSAHVHSAVPVGEPIEGNYLFVVSCQDDEGRELSLLADGEVGELMVTGVHLARGYHNNAISRTAKFIDNPLPSIVQSTDGGASTRVPQEALVFERAFLTGDLTYRSPENGLYYLRGRKDRQVKIRGVRVELEDVERQACQALGIDDGVVVLAVAQEAPTPATTAATSGPSSAMLVAVLDEAALQQSGLVTTDAVRRRLQEGLVPSMAPAIVLTVSQFPRNTTGKLDRKVLQQQVEDTFPAAAAGAQSAVEADQADFTSLSSPELAQTILRIYAEVLGVAAPDFETQSRPVDFFALGGDSVRMIEVLWRLRQWTGVTLKPVDLHLSVEQLAERLRATPKLGGTESGRLFFELFLH